MQSLVIPIQEQETTTVPEVQVNEPKGPPKQSHAEIQI